MKVFAGNHIYNMTGKEPASPFSPSGVVISSRIITDRYTRQSKNMGYAEMVVMEEGRKAVREVNGRKTSSMQLAEAELPVQEWNPMK